MNLIDSKGEALHGGFYYKELEVLPLVYIHNLTLFGSYLHLQALERFVPPMVHGLRPSDVERMGYMENV